MKKFSLIIPYYRSPLMLQKQLENVLEYMDDFDIIVVDDCSQEPAENIINKDHNIQLFRIDDDIPWNREGARNLGAFKANTEWIIHLDTDHILKKECADNLLNTSLDTNHWYRFPRYRNGKADDTRRKDAIPDDQEYGKIKPHIDSYLCTKELYMESGGYNEEYSGCLGGGGPFLKHLAKTGGESLLVPDNVYLEVYTKSNIKDASVCDLSRDKTEFKLRKKKFGTKKAINCLRFKYHQIY